MMGRSERFDTMPMEKAEERIISRVGAEGVGLCGVIECEKRFAGLGIALKVADGDNKRTWQVAAVELLRKLGILTGLSLSEVSPMPVKNRRSNVACHVEVSLEPRSL
jgi:L-asparaginase II